MSAKRQLQELIYKIRFQCGNGHNPIRTCNHCDYDECENTVIGTGKCLECLEIELSLLTNPESAERFVRHTKGAGIASYELHEALEQ